MPSRHKPSLLGISRYAARGCEKAAGIISLSAHTFLHLSAGYIVRSMPVLPFMENLLALEAETKFLLSASDRSYEQTLMQELLKIFKEAELRFGPRDTSFQLSVPRITECATSRSYIFRPLRMTRIYLSRDSRTKPWLASLELAHEAVHVLSPVVFGGR